MRSERYDARDLGAAWASLRRVKPLVFHVTNSVAMALQANVALSLGASPIMSPHPDETAELVGIADAFLLNLGTPTLTSILAAERGMAAVKERGCFSLLDPVGYGASRLRNSFTDELLRSHAFSVIKGNEGEISLLSGSGGAVRGVDSSHAGDLRGGVVRLARERSCVVCATGPEDLLSDGESLVTVSGGSALLPSVSGSGCAAGTVVLSVTAACKDAFLGTLCGLVAMGLASERAEKRCRGSASFAVALVDELHALRAEDFEEAEGRWCSEGV